MAAYHGHDTTIPFLLEADAQIDAQDNNGRTPLIFASYYGREAAVRELLKGNPNLDLKQCNGKTALVCAREEKHQSIVNLLVDHERSRSVQLLALSEAREAARAALGAQERYELDKELKVECDKFGDKSSGADRGKVKGMLDRGADPNGYKVCRT